MRSPITNDRKKCVGCNRCIRKCPVPEANIARMENGETKVSIDNDKCIACGACLDACRHGARNFVDDTGRFFDDLRRGMPISLFLAPAGRANLENWERILTLLRNMGVRKLYDVSLGADICTWGYIRHIQKNRPVSVITQPCPAIVTYILKHRPELLQYLSPVHSPMLCTAVYMRKYQGITDKIAALSPCIAKTDEFEDTGNVVSYNVTFVKLQEYIKKNNLVLPTKGSGYDHIDSSLGSVFPMPGGLKENVEFMIGKALRIDKSEGQDVVYRDLDAFAKEHAGNLPALFDVLNCSEGCNMGTACRHGKSLFAVNRSMDKARHHATEGRNQDYFENLYKTYDETLRLEDFMRRYSPRPVTTIAVNDMAVEKAFQQLGKMDEISRNFDCGACGSDTCHEMAVKIAKKINFAENCIQKAHAATQDEHSVVLDWLKRNVASLRVVQDDIANIKELVDNIVNNMSDVTNTIINYEDMSKDIDKIASNIHMISLNASIEAARAGEYGRTFAVVAEAIRKLAGETQKETLKISAASKEAKKAVESIAEIVVAIGGDISQAHDSVSKIAEDTGELLQSDDKAEFAPEDRPADVVRQAAYSPGAAG